MYRFPWKMVFSSNQTKQNQTKQKNTLKTNMTQLNKQFYGIYSWKASPLW